MIPHLRRLVGFGVLPASSLLASLALLPIIATRFGEQAWAALAIGQSIGAIIGVFVGMAWWTVGGNRIATAPDDDARRSIYRRAATSRGLVLVVLTPLGAAAAWLLAPGHHLEAVGFMVGIALNGLGASWYFAGVGRPWPLVVNEELVRLSGYVVAVLGVLAGLGLWWYAVVMVAVGLAMFCGNWLRIMGRPRRRAHHGPDAPPAPVHARRPDRSGAGAVGRAGAGAGAGAARAMRAFRAEAVAAAGVVREQASGTAGRASAAAFWYGNLSLFSLLVPGSIGEFSAVHQLQRTANNGLDQVVFAFVSWAGSASSDAELRARRRRLLAMIVATGVGVFAAWAAAGPLVVGVLYAGQVTLAPAAMLLIGAVIALALMSTAVEVLVMVPAGLERRVFAVNRVTAAGGLALLAVLAPPLGVLGALISLVAVPLASITAYAWFLVRATRRATCSDTAEPRGASSGSEPHDRTAIPSRVDSDDDTSAETAPRP